MVRTLVFHSNNVGSIPASLKMWLSNTNLYSNNRVLTKKKFRQPTIRYSFRFTSLVAPHTPSFIANDGKLLNPLLTRRAFLKKSYLLASWLLYLSHKPTSNIAKSTPRIAILPSSQIVYTLTKAPMAHKTNSKEQFLFKYYNFKFSTELKLPLKAAPSTINQGAYSMVLTKELFPVFETNLLFLKYYNVSYSIRDKDFFQHLV